MSLHRPAFASTASRLLVSAGLFVVLFCGLPAKAAAQSGLSIEVSPLRVELKMGAKATHTQAISLRNNSAAAVHVRARVDEYWLSLDGTPQFKYANAAEAFSASGWVRVNPSELTLKPGESGTVRATTTVPADARDGSYRCAVMFEFDPPGVNARDARRDMQFRGRVATLIYATVGSPKTAVELVDLQVQQASKTSAPDVIATLTNAGRGYVRTKGTLVISTADGRKVRELPVPSVPVMPESRRELRVSTTGSDEVPLEPGQYKVELRLDVGQTALLVGETTLEVARIR